VILIDSPPSLGLLTVNSLAAAQEVIIPIQCEYYALEGLSQLLRNVDLVTGNLNPELKVGGVVLTMYDARTKLSKDVADQVREYFGDVAYRTVVPRSVRLSEAPSYGEPIEDMVGEDEDTVTLAEVCPKVKSKLTYEYDFGDGWEHIIEVQKIEEPKPGVEYPVCLAGKKACPPEDCGGVYGYYHMLDVVADPDHEEHDDIVEWLGDDFDADAFDIDEVNDMLAQWREG